MEKLIRKFTYHPPKGDQPTRYNELRSAALAFAKLIEKYCPDSQERDISIAKLEECVMWANAGIARNE